jgi:PAS domain S-box-containing protein
MNDEATRKRAEEALRESEERYRLLAENMRDAIWTMDIKNLRFTYMSPSITSLTGYSVEEVMSRTLEELLTSASYGLAMKTFAEELTIERREQKDLQRSRTLEFELNCKDGSTVWVEAKMNFLRDSDGQPLEILGVSRDITDRKRAEEALRESEEKYRTLIERANDGICIIQDGIVKYLNLRLAEMWGGTVEEVTGTPFSEYVHPDERPKVVEYYKRRMAGEAIPGIYETALRRKDGSKVYAELNAGTVPYQGNVADFVFVRDITGRKLEEGMLRESEDRYHTMFKDSPVSLWDEDFSDVKRNLEHLRDSGVMDFRNYFQEHPEEITNYTKMVKIVDVNTATLDMYQAESKEEILAGLSTVFSQESYDAFREGLVAIAESKTLFETEAITRTLKGNKNNILLRWSVVPGFENSLTKVLVSTIDITERKQAEVDRARILKELEAKNRELERFTYTVSHDLRSPLVTIQGFAEMLNRDLQANQVDKATSDLQYITNATVKMDELLSATLVLSRIGRIANPPEDVPFGTIVAGAVEQTSGELHANTIEVSVAKDFPVVHVDWAKLEEVLVNLIGNSIKYRGDQPHPKIEIGHRRKGAETVFFVKDNGIGIDKSEQDKVFDLFYRVDKSTEGTGAGLAIVKRIIEVHGGRIWIESELGTGCTVCFTLPVV